MKSKRNLLGVTNVICFVIFVTFIGLTETGSITDLTIQYPKIVEPGSDFSVTISDFQKHSLKTKGIKVHWFFGKIPIWLCEYLDGSKYHEEILWTNIRSSSCNEIKVLRASSELNGTYGFSVLRGRTEIFQKEFHVIIAKFAANLELSKKKAHPGELFILNCFITPWKYMTYRMIIEFMKNGSIYKEGVVLDQRNDRKVIETKLPVPKSGNRTIVEFSCRMKLDNFIFKSNPSYLSLTSGETSIFLSRTQFFLIWIAIIISF